MPEERIVYGCVGADRSEAQQFIDDGLLVYSNTAEGMRLRRRMPLESKRDKLSPG